MNQSFPHTTPAERYQFLSGGGEMGRLMRSKDWSGNPAGTPDTWPQSLRTTLSIILHSKFPMFLFWGPELICFYNDAYRPSLGQNGKHPSILGQRGEEGWPEIWDTIKPLIDQVLAGGEATWSEDQLIPIYRNNTIEDVYWTFSYSPVRDETGKPAGVFVTCSETTGKVNSLKKLEESNRRYLNNMMQAPVAMCILRGADHIVEIANELMLEVWGKTAGDVLNKPLFEGLPEAKGQGFEYLLRNVYDTGEKFAASERPVNLPRNGKIEATYINFVYEALKEPDGTITGIVAIASDVTMQVLARQKIEVSEREFRQLADSLPELVWTTDNKGNQTFASRRWNEFTGLDPNNVATFEKMVHPDDLDAIIKEWGECLATGKTYKAQLRLRHKNGSYHWFYANGEAIRNENGEIEKWIGAFTNINEQKEDQERLNIIIRASELGTWDLNLKTKKVNYSNRYLEIFGYKDRVELTHEQLLKHLHRDDLSVREEAFRQAFVTGFLQYESRIIWNDNSIHWMEGKGKVFFDEENQPHLLIGTVRDITAEKHYQEELQEREQKFRVLADSMPQFVWTGDAAGNLNYFNLSVYNYSGLTPEQMSKEGWIQIVHPDDREENIKSWAASVSTGKDFLFEHRFRRADGEYRWQLSRAIPQRDSAGIIQMWVGTSTDIQEIKELDQQKDFFISMASHELKTPITSIKGYVQMLQSMYGKSEDNFLNNSLRVIDKQIITLTNLISDLLDLSKIKTGNLLLHKESVPVNELITEVIDEIEHINPSYQFIFSGEPGIVVTADRERIGQVLRNLLTNAVKYSPDNRTVNIKSVMKDNALVVAVEDAGIGISAGNQEKIFQRFYRVEGKNEKTFPGFGIGLFISSEIIHRHNGKMWVNSEPGKGSIFYFSLPPG